MVPPEEHGNWLTTDVLHIFTTDKFVDYLQIKLTVEVDIEIKVRLYCETYYSGNIPELISLQQIPDKQIIEPLEEMIFSINVTNSENIDTCGVSMKYIDTGNIKHFEGIKSWENEMYELIYIPKYNGSYLYCGYIDLGFWSIIYTTSFYSFIVENIEYPKDSYLSIFSSLDGFPLESKDYKVYLGESEEYSLVDFREYYGNWSKIYSSNITVGFIDDYIRFEAISNGLKTYFKNMVGVNTFVFNTLLFEMKIENPLILTLIYNPNVIEKTYYLSLNESYVNTWYSVILPIFNFTTYKDIYNNYLFNLGFYLNSGNISIANIRLGKYYDVSFSIEKYNYTQIIEESDSLDLTVNWNDNSKVLNESAFNYTNIQKTNVFIENNQTIRLNFTGNFVSEYSFIDDTIGSNPINWTVIDGVGCNSHIISFFNEHNKVLKLEDTGIGSCQVYNDFSEQTLGIIEFWVYVSDGTQMNKIYIQDINNGGNIYVWIDTDNKLKYNDGLWHDITTISNNIWYYLQFNFSGGVGWELTVNNVLYGLGYSFAFLGSFIDANRMYFGTLTSDSNYDLYIDAIDYSWSDGYYVNRNRNNTFFPNGSYISKTYDLGIGESYFYENITWIQEVKCDSNVTLQYRVSDDNITWGTWSEIIVTNLSINEEKLRYFQFGLNFTSEGNFTDTFKCFEVNLSYILKYKYYELANYTITIEFSYNETYRVIERGIYNLTMNLTVFNNQSNYDLYLFNYTCEEYVIIESLNYTNEILNTFYYNITEFRIRFFVNSTVDYDFGFNLTLNNTYYEIWNNTDYTSNSYRLISPENRKNPNLLKFNSEYETLAILDFFNNTLYRELVRFSNYTDIGLSISTVLFINWYNYTLLVTIERGLGTTLQVVIPPESSIMVRIFTTSYNVEARNEALEIINVTSISFNQSSYIIIRYGERKEIEIPQFDLLTALIEFFFTTTLGFVVFCIIVLGIGVFCFDSYINLKNYRKNRKNRKNDRKERRVRELKENYGSVGI